MHCVCLVHLTDLHPPHVHSNKVDVWSIGVIYFQAIWFAKCILQARMSNLLLDHDILMACIGFVCLFGWQVHVADHRSGSDDH
jgi:hypothetical protein